MPHLFSLQSVSPLLWSVTEYVAARPNIAALQLTGKHMHAQPIVIKFKDSSVGVAFFENDGRLLYVEQLYPDLKTLKPSEIHKIPVELKRIPVPHIPRKEENIETLEKLQQNNLPISTLATKEHR
jgi:hypothetical protein